MSSYVVGLTGGIACGKSNLSSALKAAGAPVIDADEISRSLTAPGGPALPALREAFGDGIFEDEKLNRRALASLIFKDSAAREKLNSILHPLIFERMKTEIQKHSGPVVLDVPLLYECGMAPWCDEIWCAYLPQKQQIRRLVGRDRLTWREALRRIRSQMPAREKARRADRVIRTEGSREESARIVLSLWQSLLQNLQDGKGE